MQQTTAVKQTSGRRWPVFVTLLALSAGACADDGQSVPHDGDEDGAEPGALLQAPAEPQTVSAPNGAYFAEITANGTGCPPGSTSISISEDGQVFTVVFSEYEVNIAPTQPVAVKDCQLSIKLKSPDGLSYAVNNFYYTGFAYLEQGVTGRQTANYYFQGLPLTSREVRGDLVGPHDEGFLFEDEVVTPESLVWSPCGVERSMQISTRLRLANGTPAGSGYMNLAAVDGETKLVLGLAFQRCAAAGSNADRAVATPPATTTRSGANTPAASAPPAPTPPASTTPTGAPPGATAPATSAPSGSTTRPGATPSGSITRPGSRASNPSRAGAPAATPPASGARAPSSGLEGALGGVVEGLGGAIDDVLGGLGGLLGGNTARR